MSIVVFMPPLVTGCSRSVLSCTGAELIRPSDGSVLPSSFWSFFPASFSLFCCSALLGSADARSLGLPICWIGPRMDSAACI